GPAVSDNSTIALKFNNVTVTPTSLNKSTNGITTIRYTNPATPLTAGATNTVSLSVSDTRAISVSKDRTFVVPGYYSLPPSFAVSAVDTSKPGFKIKVHQVDKAQTLPNSVARAERQLHGDIGPSVANVTTGSDGYLAQPGVINFEQAAGVGGVFNSNNGFPDE